MGVFKLCSSSDKLWSYMVYNSSRKWALYFLCGLAQKVINNRSVACLPTKENWRIDRVCKELRKYKKKKRNLLFLHSSISFLKNQESVHTNLKMTTYFVYDYIHWGKND